MSQEIIFDISELLPLREGENLRYEVVEPISFLHGGVNLETTVNVLISATRLKKGIHILIEKLEYKLNHCCNQCTKTYINPYRVTNTERIFYFNQSDVPEDDPFDQFFVNNTNVQINLYDFIRQEILLHFPLDLVCSTHCKGICAQCGINLNHQKCDCQEVPEQIIYQNKPLGALKDLFKNNQ